MQPPPPPTMCSVLFSISENKRPSDRVDACTCCFISDMSLNAVPSTCIHNMRIISLWKHHCDLFLANPLLCLCTVLPLFFTLLLYLFYNAQLVNLVTIICALSVWHEIQGNAVSFSKMNATQVVATLYESVEFQQWNDPSKHVLSTWCDYWTASYWVRLNVWLRTKLLMCWDF